MPIREPEETVLSEELKAAYALIRTLHRDILRLGFYRRALTEQEQITLKAAIEAGAR
jgi:hypothetical protein